MAIMQPYFFPYIGHFGLIAACDEWIVFDLTQYTPKSWMNRNRVLHPAGGLQWLTLPLARSSIHMRTHEAAIADVASARQMTLGRLTHYRQAPYYAAVREIVEGTFTANPSLTYLNARGLERVCAYICLPFRYRIASSLALNLPPSLGPGGWAPAISAALGATDYINPAGGQCLFDPADFTRHGIGLHFLHARPYIYQPGRFSFEPNLSILDALMWNPPEVVRAAVLDYTLHHANAAACLPASI